MLMERQIGLSEPRNAQRQGRMGDYREKKHKRYIFYSNKTELCN